MNVPTLETERLLIRPFALDNLAVIHQILDVELARAEFGTEGAKLLSERAQWLQWTILNYDELAKLYQPPYGDRAVVLKQSGQLIGACGYVPCLDAFEQLPSLHPPEQESGPALNTPELGLFYAMSPSAQGQGYATEAARALVDYAFAHLKLKRIIATTTADNAASMQVMRHLGMRVETNPLPEPPWLQVVGILENHPAG
ncbi:MAG TPA: GNAT family protein [Ktedonobacterales bacterium]